MSITEIPQKQKLKAILTLTIYAVINIIHYVILYFLNKNLNDPSEALYSIKYIVMYFLNIIFILSLILLLYKDSYITSIDNRKEENNKDITKKNDNLNEVNTFTINNFNQYIENPFDDNSDKSLSKPTENKMNSEKDIDDSTENDFCSICSVYYPLRARHCLKCDKCVVGYDHHCNFLSICIGEKNKIYFLFFLFITSCFLLNTILILLSNSLNIIGNFQEETIFSNSSNFSYLKSQNNTNDNHAILNNEIDNFVYINNLKSYILYNSIVFIPLMIYSQVLIYIISLLKLTFLLIIKNITSCEYYSWNKIDYMIENSNGSSVFCVDEGYLSNIKLLFNGYRYYIIQENQKNGSSFNDIDWRRYLKNSV